MSCHRGARNDKKDEEEEESILLTMATDQTHGELQHADILFVLMTVSLECSILRF